MMYKRGLLIDVYRRAGQRFENERAVTSASAGLLVHKPKTQQQQLAPSVSGHQAARAGARASKSVNHLESLISIFFLKKKIYLSLLMMFYREIKIVWMTRPDGSTYVYCSLGCFLSMRWAYVCAWPSGVSTSMSWISNHITFGKSTSLHLRH